jgi:lysophospholipase L1-like esterase
VPDTLVNVYDGISWVPIYPVSDISQSPTLALMARRALAARTNNPRVNAVMSPAPAITSGAAPLSGLTNSWAWNGPTAGVFNYYGGAPADDHVGYIQFNSTTVSGSLNPYVARVEIVADAAKISFSILNVGSGYARFIVNGQYVSLTPTTPAGGGGYISLDFTSAGGRAVRSIIIEMAGLHFNSVWVGPTETVTKATGSVQRMMIVGDSFTGTGGMSTLFQGFAQIVADLLGIRDVWNNGVGGTGYLATSGQTTFRQRLSDMVTAAPDVALIVGGHNDTAFAPGAVQTEVRTYLTAIRNQTALKTIPLIIAGVTGANIPLATTQPVEREIANAVSSMNDPLILFLPDVTDLAGPYFTGTGNTSATTGAGNCDVYISSDAVHPNDAGHAYLARCLADDIMRLVLKV